MNDAGTPKKWFIPTVGTWLAKPASHPEVEWQGVCETPAEVTPAPGQVYGYQFHGVLDVPDEELSEFVGAIRGFPQLWWLNLQGCRRMTPQALQQLGELPSLRALAVNSCRGRADQALAVLRDLPELTYLDIEGFAQVSDRELAHLQGLTRMHTLTLSACPRISDEGLRQLLGMKDLESLGLNGCDITDRGVALLAQFPKLRLLDLMCDRITDRSLGLLQQMPALKYVGLPRSSTFLARLLAHCGVRVNSRISGGAVERLRQELPECEVWQALY